jgi:hypothetical protein
MPKIYVLFKANRIQFPRVQNVHHALVIPRTLQYSRVALQTKHANLRNYTDDLANLSLLDLFGLNLLLQISLKNWKSILIYMYISLIQMSPPWIWRMIYLKTLTLKVDRSVNKYTTWFKCNIWIHNLRIWIALMYVRTYWITITYFQHSVLFAATPLTVYDTSYFQNASIQSYIMQIVVEGLWPKYTYNYKQYVQCLVSTRVILHVIVSICVTYNSVWASEM